MILGKKGQTRLTQNELVGIILVVVGAALIVLFIARTTPLYGDVFDSETCRGSVAAKAVIESSTILSEGIGTTKLACKTKDVCINSGGRCPTGSKKESVVDKEDIKKEISKLMYECWYQLGEGELDFVQDELFNTKVCTICSRIKFSEDAQKDIKTVSGLNEYLSKEKPFNSKFTYLQHFTKSPQVELLGTEQPLDLTKEYAIVYTIYSSEYLFNLFGAGTAGVAGMIGGAKLGAAVGTLAGPVGTSAGFLIGGGIGGIVGTIAGDAAVEKLESAVTDKNQKIFSLYLIEHDAATIAKSCTGIEGLG